MNRYEALLENYRNAWAGLRMIREAIEELGPVGTLPSPEAVIGKYGPEPIHEAQAIGASEYSWAARRQISPAVGGLGQRPYCPVSGA